MRGDYVIVLLTQQLLSLRPDLALVFLASLFGDTATERLETRRKAVKKVNIRYSMFS